MADINSVDPSDRQRRHRDGVAWAGALAAVLLLAGIVALTPALASVDLRLPHLVWFVGAMGGAGLVAYLAVNAGARRYLAVVSLLLSLLAMGHALTLSGDWYYFALAESSRSGDLAAAQRFHDMHESRKGNAAFSIKLGEDYYLTSWGLWSEREVAASMRIGAAALRADEYAIAEEQFIDALSAARAKGSSADVVQAIERGLAEARGGT